MNMNNKNKKSFPLKKRLGMIKNFLKKHWWEVIKKFCSALIAIFTLILLYQANVMLNLNNEIYKKELYPHFRIVESIENKNGDGDYTDSIIRIKNYGGNFYSFTPKVRTYIPLIIDDIKYMLPLNGFYTFTFKYSSGDIVSEHSYINNNLKILNMLEEINKILRDENISGSYDYPNSYIKIEYQDIFGGIEIQYFKAYNSEKIDNITGKKYVDDFKPSYTFNNKHYSFDIDSLTVDLLYEFATTDLKVDFLN